MAYLQKRRTLHQEKYQECTTVDHETGI